jgi:dTDP-4-dehydrorhamnose reductase
MHKISVYGSSGFLGIKLVKYFLSKNYYVSKDSKNFKVKLKKKKNIFNLLLKDIKKNKPDTIINLVALTNVDHCEKQKNLAINTNSIFLKELTKSINCYSKNIHVIHISTDQVYNGTGQHKENKTSPVNYYGLTKLKGENFAKKIFSTILRTNFIGKGSSKQKANLSDWIVNNVKKNNEISTYKNIFFSPLHTTTLIKLIEKVLKAKRKGTFNLAAKTKISKAEFAKLLCKGLKLNTRCVKVINYKYSNLLAKRPLDMSLNVTKFEKIFNIKLPKVTKEIKKLAQDYL